MRGYDSCAHCESENIEFLFFPRVHSYRLVAGSYRPLPPGVTLMVKDKPDRYEKIITSIPTYRKCNRCGAIWTLEYRTQYSADGTQDDFSYFKFWSIDEIEQKIIKMKEMARTQGAQIEVGVEIQYCSEVVKTKGRWIFQSQTRTSVARKKTWSVFLPALSFDTDKCFYPDYDWINHWDLIAAGHKFNPNWKVAFNKQ